MWARYGEMSRQSAEGATADSLRRAFASLTATSGQA